MGLEKQTPALPGSASGLVTQSRVGWGFWMSSRAQGRIFYKRFFDRSTSWASDHLPSPFTGGPLSWGVRSAHPTGPGHPLRGGRKNAEARAWSHLLPATCLSAPSLCCPRGASRHVVFGGVRTEQSPTGRGERAVKSSCPAPLRGQFSLALCCLAVKSSPLGPAGLFAAKPCSLLAM